MGDKMNNCEQIKNIFDRWLSRTKDILSLFVLTSVFTALGIVLAEKEIYLSAGFTAICNSFLTVVRDSIRFVAIILVPCFLSLYVYTVCMLGKLVWIKKKSIGVGAGFDWGRIVCLILADIIFLYFTLSLAYQYLGFDYRVCILGFDLSILQQEPKGNIRLYSLFNFFWQCTIVGVVFVIKWKYAGKKSDSRNKLILLLFVLVFFWMYYNIKLVAHTFNPYYFNIFKPAIKG